MLKKGKILRSAEKYAIDRKFGQAVGEYRKLLEGEPDEPTLLNTVGELLIREQRPEEALEYFRQVAEIYRSDGSILKAIAMFKKIVHVAPTDFTARDTLATLYRKKGLKYDAGRELKVLVKQQEEAGKAERALLYLKRLLGVDPSDATIWQHTARLLQQRGKSDEAVEHYVGAIERFRETGAHQSAFETASRALKIQCTHRDLLEAYVNAAEATGRLSAAEDLLKEQVAGPHPGFACRLFLGRVLEKRGHAEEACQVYRELSKEGYDDPLITEGLIRTGWGEEEPPPEESQAEAPVGEEKSFFEPQEEQGPPSPVRTSEDSPQEAPSSGVFSFQLEEDESSAEIEVDTPADELFAAAEPGEDGGVEEEGAANAAQAGVSSLEEALEEADFYLKLGFQEDAQQLLARLIREHPEDPRVLRRADKVIDLPGEESPETAPGVTREPAASAQPVDLETEIESALEGLFTGDQVEDSSGEVLRYDITSRTSQKEENPQLHYDLGLAYKEMGLVEDAVQEFLKAFEMIEDPEQNPQKILCCSMLANAFRQLDRIDDAVQWAQTGLQVPGKKDFEWKALQFDLACALEERGDIGQSLQAYREILPRDPQYRDVQDRVDRLSSGSRVENE
ncbi:MAG: tetratricopeptide repeat protein [Acidobacteriota bacterium]